MLICVREFVMDTKVAPLTKSLGKEVVMPGDTAVYF